MCIPRESVIRKGAAVFTLALMAIFEPAVAKDGSVHFLGGDNKGSAPELRSFNGKDQEISVYVDLCKAKDEVLFEESERQTRIASDFEKLVKTIVFPAEAPPCPNWTKKPYTLKFARSLVKVTATSIDGKDKESVTIVTGPEEHWYMAIDLPVTSSKTLKYDSSSKELVPQGNNHQLYLSINYLVGDVMSSKWKSWYDPFSAKLLVAAQSKPLDSVGVGVGYRLPKIDAWDLSLNSFEIFVGRFWTKQDKISDGQPQLNMSTRQSWLVGVSYNFDDGLKWVRK